MENMPLIAGLYKVIKKIGSGGGGTVYLAEHSRLGKNVVLKADKRALSTKPEVLRREVDALKALNHTYIPQVYDFVEEDGIVYTVMDYIDGESFDRPLKRGERFTQPQVIEWACQLLEALVYLHSRPPHGILHADIKPANVMLTPQGDVRLIDFNIALALGEEGAVAVGRSFGYASPEHYGLEYKSGSITQGLSINASTDFSDTTATYIETLLDSTRKQGSSSDTSGKKSIMLNVRSDIYSLGATLYHIMTGRRPAQDANEVEPISTNEYSTAVVDIISKAMNPDSELRWQSAAEMLHAFEHLRENDPRTRRHKRITIVTAAVLAGFFLAGGLTAFAGQRTMTAAADAAAAEALRQEEIARQQEQEAQQRAYEESVQAAAARTEAEKESERAQVTEAYVLVEYSANALRDGDMPEAVSYALQALALSDPAGFKHEHDPPLPHLPVAEARRALTDALGVYDLSDGFKPYRYVTLSSENTALRIAPDGGSFAAMSFGELSVFDTKSGELAVTLPALESGLAEVKYADNESIAYAAPNGITAYHLPSASVLWTGAEATGIVISGDGNRVAAVNRDADEAVLYSMDDGSRTTVSFDGKRQAVAFNDRFGNPDDKIFSLNYDGTLLAVSFSGGGLEIINTSDREKSIEIFDESDYTYFEGGFFGKYFALSATNEAESLFAVVDTERFAVTISTTLSGRIGVTAEENGIYMSYNNIHVMIDPETAVQTPLGYDPKAQIAEGYQVAGSLNSPIVRISKYDSNADKEIFAYDSDYIHDEARLNIAGNRLMLFSFDHFRIYDIDGAIINETAIPNAEQVYDQQYRRIGGESYLEVTYYDGTVYKYSGDDGTMTAAPNIPAPDPSLYEEFETEFLRILSPLQGAPTAHDIITGELVRELEQDAYLTYVTQIGEYVVTEYVSAYGDRYALLLDGRTCETLAYIPNLCDVIGDRLIVDIRASGSIRETRLYHPNELISMARSIIVE